jgi:hypothetical protein
MCAGRAVSLAGRELTDVVDALVANGAYGRVILTAWRKARSISTFEFETLFITDALLRAVV